MTVRRLVSLLVAALVVLALAAPAGAVERPPGPSGPLSFPRDHQPHFGYGVEWWYTTGIVEAEDGTRYGVLWVLFGATGGAVAVSQVVDLDRDRIVHHSEQISFGGLPPGPLDERSDDHYVTFTDTGRYGRWRVRMDGDESGLDLTLVPTKPYVRHGKGGIVQQADGGPSAYYSSTRMRARGTLTVDGKVKQVRGGAFWLDRQWGNYDVDPDALRWDWFSCRFANGTELMLYQFVEPDGRTPSRYRAGTFVERDGRVRRLGAFTATQLGPSITPPGASASYGYRWRLRVPSLDLRVTLTPLARNQYVDNRIVASFWEGAARATGTSAGKCFVELSREARATAG
ncbi:MAG: lipocalin-like domain-containing protein [Thermoleophilia bacterium]